MTNKLRDSKGLYWGLIITFFILYVCVGFVSTLHSITFFELANTMGLAILLGLTYEVGQAAVLFSILMSKNNQNLLPWTLMILLTALQVTANVYASFKFMDASGSMDWQFWQRSILFWMEADAEMFKVVISWISGALLPVVALGMTALVADNLKLKDEDDNKTEDLSNLDKDELQQYRGLEALKKAKENYEEEVLLDEQPVDKVIYDTKDKNENTKIIDQFKKYDSINNQSVGMPTVSTSYEEIEPQFIVDIPTKIMDGYHTESTDIEEKDSNLLYNDDFSNLDVSRNTNKLEAVIKNEDMMEPKIPEVKPELFKRDASTNKNGEKIPITRGRGWHLKKEYIDTNGDVYHFGVYQPDIKPANFDSDIQHEILKIVNSEIPNIVDDVSKKA